MRLVILLYPDGQRKKVILGGVPREGDRIRLRASALPLVVEQVLWMEADNGIEPDILVSVRAASR